MSKRGAADYITKDGIGSMESQDAPSAQRATAAQLANRKIAAAKPRSGSARHRQTTPGASSGLSSGGSSFGGGFGAQPSQSFPPVNGAQSIGNGSASASFGGFGSGGGGGGFNFNAGGGGGFNNPFAQPNNAPEQPATNGGFNFGGGAGGNAQSSPFQFGASQPAQQPASNMFGASQPQSQPTPSFGGGFGQSQSTNMFGQSNAQPQQSSTPSFGGFGSTPAPATTTSNMFGNTFGATAGQTQTQSTPSFGGFGQSQAPATSTPAPSFGGGFGQAPLPAFGQLNGDVSMNTSPQKPLWNKSVQNGLDAAAEKSGAESPDRPPHVEQVGDTPPNVFANLKRPPPQPTASPAPAKPLFSFGKPAEQAKVAEPEKAPEPEKEKEKENATPAPSFFTPAKETSTPAPAASNPFASLQRMPESERPSLFSSTPKVEQPKPQSAATPSFFNTSSTPKPAEPASTPTTNLFQPKTRLSGFFSEKPKSPEKEKSPEPQQQPAKVNLFAASSGTGTAKVQWGQQTPSAPAASTPSFFKSAPAPAVQPPSPPKPTNAALPAPATSSLALTTATPQSMQSELYQKFLPELTREDNLPPPPSGLNLTAEQIKLHYKKLKVARLNKIWLQILPRLSDIGDLSPFLNDYTAFMAEIKGTTLDGRFEVGSQEQEREQVEGTNKRRAVTQEDDGNEDREKRTKLNGSSTVNKFESILGGSAASPTPAASTSSLFSKAAAPATASPAKNLFSATPSAAPSTSLFSAAPAATPAASSSTDMFSKTATPANGSLFPAKKADEPPAASPAPSFGGFKPTLSSTPADTSNKTPAFSGFKPTLSSGSTSSLPKFGGGSGGSFMSSFAASAEETAKKEKQKAMDDDYDSDEETKEQWSARYDRELAEKRKKQAEEAKKSAANSFKFTPTSSVAGSHAGSVNGDDEDKPKGMASFLAPPAGNSLFSGMSRSASPASQAGSVFDAPRSGTPVSKDNPFAKFTSQPVSEKGDADDEEDEEEEDEASQEEASVSGNDRSLQLDGQYDTQSEVANGDTEDESTPRPNGVKRRGPFEEDDSAAETPAKTPRTDGLFGRVSRDGDRTPLASTNAPNTNSLFSTSKPADQTWTPKDPIKFSSSTNNGASDAESTTAKKPLFSFTPANNSQPQSGVFSGLFSGTKTSATPSGTATPSNPFASLTTPADKLKASSSLFPPASGATSVFSTPGLSRATTPGLSDMSGAESTAGEEETKPDAQIEISDLSNDTKDSEVIFQSAKVKATRFEKGEGDEKDKWNVIGVGPIAVFTKDEVTTLLMRAHPSGKIILNNRMTAVHNPQQIAKRVRMLLMTKEGPQSYLVAFGKEEEAREFVEAAKGSGAK